MLLSVCIYAIQVYLLLFKATMCVPYRKKKKDWWLFRQYSQLIQELIFFFFNFLLICERINAAANRMSKVPTYENSLVELKEKIGFSGVIKVLPVKISFRVSHLFEIILKEYGNP